MKIKRNSMLFGILLTVLLTGVQAGAAQSSLVAPTGLQVKSESRGVVLQWQPAKGSLGYRIYWEKDADREVSQASPWLADTTENALQYAVSDLTPGISYAFRVSALYASGEGPLSNQVSIILKAVPQEVPSDSAP